MCGFFFPMWNDIPDSKVHGANMGPIWVLSAPDGPHVGPTNLAIRDVWSLHLIPPSTVSGLGLPVQRCPHALWQQSPPQIARFMGPAWGPYGADRTQVGPMLALMKFVIWVQTILDPLIKSLALISDQYCKMHINKANLRDLIAATGLVILLKFDPNHRFFVPCDLEIWWMALENNRAPLLYYIKLCASFQIHRWIQIGITVRKR